MPDDSLTPMREALRSQRHADALNLAETFVRGQPEALVRGGPEASLSREAHRVALQAAYFLDDGETARRHAFAALALATESGEPASLARAHNDVAVLFGSAGLLEHALDHLWQAVHVTEAAGGEVEGGPLNNLGNVYMDLDRVGEAVALFDRARERYTADGKEIDAATALANLGRAHALSGQVSLAVPALDAALEAFERLGRLDEVTTTYAKLGVAHGRADVPYRARDAFEQALSLHAQGHGTRVEAETRQWYGEWALGQGHVATALEQLRVAVDRYGDQVELLARARVLEPLSRALEAAGETAEALATLRRHVELEATRHRTMAEASLTVRLIELELGTHGEQEIARLHTLELERANAELRRQTERLEELSTTDALTGLRNRRALERRAHEELAEAARYDRPLVLALLDLDRFKAVNDTFSHEVGDRVLRRVAELLRTNLRGSDVAARWGGEEFALLLPDLEPDDAASLLERIRRAIATEPWDGIAPGLRITSSIGMAVFTEAPTLVDLLRLADRRLYAAKGDGRDRTVVAG